jgi:hypothetical protein
MTYLSPQEAVAYLLTAYGIRISTKTLSNRRSDGTGPDYVRDGLRPLYPQPGLDTWAQERLGKPVSSTTEERSRGARLPTGGAA